MSDDVTGGKGLEFSVVALASVGCMPANGGDAQEQARVFHVAVTRVEVGDWACGWGVKWLQQ